MGDAAIRERIAGVSGWQVQKQLGRGQYGTAYLVEWEDQADGKQQDPSGARPGDQAVAKVVGLEFLPEKEQKLAFQEVELMRALKHAHIVALRDHFMTDHNLELVIVMEFCDCGDLRGEVKKRASTKPPNHIPEAQIMTWFVQLTQALNYMHQRHILHRDLKSSNIFLTASANEGRDVRIGDFGIARVLEGTVDVAATVVGTPYYMSPEVCKSEAYGFKSDIWALGCVLYEMCMLKHAFESASLLGLVYKIVSEAYDPIPPQYSADLRSLIERVLDKSHYTRPTGKELMADGYVRKFDTTGSSSTPVASAAAAAAAGAPPVNRLAPGDGVGAMAGAAHLGGPPPRQQQQPPPRTTLAAMKASMPQRSSVGAAAPPGAGAGGGMPGMRTVEPTPGPPRMEAAGTPAPGPGPASRPTFEDQPVRRQWCAPPFVATSQPLTEDELRAKLLLNRIRRALGVRRQNWLQVFASFDTKGSGQLGELEFERAVTSMALGLSDQEIREIRIFLQGSGSCLPVDQFGSALHQSSPEVAKTEEWGRATLLELAREATSSVGASGGVAPGAIVRIQGLQSTAGVKLNGSEGVVEKWEAENLRWVVRLSEGCHKSIRDDNLHVLRVAPARHPSTPSGGDGGKPETASLYHLLCEDGQTAIPEQHFLKVVKKLLPKLDDREVRRLVLLQPKNPEGHVDVPELLAHVVQPLVGEQTLRVGAGGLLPGPGSPKMAKPKQFAGPDFRPTTAGPPLQTHWGGPTSPSAKASALGVHSPTRLPGAVASPRSSAVLYPGPAAAAAAADVADGGGGGGSAPSSSSASSGPRRALAEAALLRLAQRLLGRVGPGLAVLRLFAASADVLRLEEMNAAVSVLPLGISRAEVQGLFAHVWEVASGGLQATQHQGVLSFEKLAAALESALVAGVPTEAAALERVDLSRLGAALQRLGPPGKGGRTSPQQFRVTLMQAEPYLTRGQLEWMMNLTDKDGEGRLLPWSLLVRLGGAPPAQQGVSMVPPRLAPGPYSPVAPAAPRTLVATATLSRMRARLSSAGPSLDLERVLCLFGIAMVGDDDASVSRDVLVTLLSQLNLGISAAEAHDLVTFLAGGSTPGRPSVSASAADSSVSLASLYLALQRAGEPESESLIGQLRELAIQRLIGCGPSFAAALSATCLDGGDWVPEADFRRSLAIALVDDASPGGSSPTDDEDRLLLLAEKNAFGEVRWRPFAHTFFRLEDDDFTFEGGERQWRIPGSPKSPHLRIDTREPQQQPQSMHLTQQSWRSMKTAQAASTTSRSVVTPMTQVAEPPSPRKRGFCPCRRRYKV